MFKFLSGVGFGIVWGLWAFASFGNHMPVPLNALSGFVLMILTVCTAFKAGEE